MLLFFKKNLIKLVFIEFNFLDVVFVKILANYIGVDCKYFQKCYDGSHKFSSKG